MPSATRSSSGPLLAGDVADGRADQAEEVPLDPVAREIVGNGEDEPLTVQLEAVRLPEPGAVRGVVECPSEPTGDFTPQALRSQLDLVLHPATGPLFTSRTIRAASIPTCENTANGGTLQALPTPPVSLHSCGKQWGKLPFRPGSEA